MIWGPIFCSLNLLRFCRCHYISLKPLESRHFISKNGSTCYKLQQKVFKRFSVQDHVFYDMSSLQKFELIYSAECKRSCTQCLSCRARFMPRTTWASNERENSLADISCHVLISYQLHEIINQYTILSFVEACRKRPLFTDRSCCSVAPQFLLTLPPALAPCITSRILFIRKYNVQSECCS